MVTLRITPPPGQPYMAAAKNLHWPKGAVEQSVDVALLRGVVVRGKVTEAGSGAPVAEATLGIFRPRRSANGPRSDDGMPGTTSQDGSFQLVAVPGPGHLIVNGPADDFVLQEIGLRVLLDEGQSGGSRLYAHAFRALDAKPGNVHQEVDLSLKRGWSVKGSIVGADGEPVHEAWMVSRVIMRSVMLRSWTGNDRATVYDGRFALHGLDPDAEVPVHFLDPKGKRGATFNVSVRLVKAERVTVRLEPCGAAKIRLVDSALKPLTQFSVDASNIVMVVTPGPTSSVRPQNAGQLFADEAPLARIDSINYDKPIVSDDQGRISLPVLIPGATYRFIDRTTSRDPTGPQVRREFTAKSGETLDLGDIRIDRPPPKP